MDERDWTASKLARKSKLSHVYMGHLLRGDRTEGDKQSRISVQTVTALANALEVPEYKLLLAYKGIDPDKAHRHLQEGFNIYAEIYTAAESQGVDLNHIDSETRHQLESTVIKLSRKLLKLLVEEELERLKQGSEPNKLPK